MEEEVVHLKRETENLKKLLEKEKKKNQSIKKTIEEKQNSFSKVLQSMCKGLEISLDIGTSNLIDCQETFICLR